MNDTPSFDFEFQHALAHHRAGGLAEAEQLYLALLRDEPRHAAANHHLGLLAAQGGRTDAALPFLRTAIECAPHEETYWAVYIDALRLVGHGGDASTVEALARGRGLLQAPGATPAAAPADEARAMAEEFAATLATLDSLNMHDAVEALALQMTSLLPQQGLGWKMLAKSRLARERVVDAHEPLRRAAALLPQDAQLQQCLHAVETFLQATAAHHDGRFDAAYALYQESLAADPSNAAAQYNFAVLAVQAGRYEEALSHLETALGLNPNQEQYWAAYVNALAQAGRKDAAAIALEMAKLRGLNGAAVETLARLMA